MDIGLFDFNLRITSTPNVTNGALTQLAPNGTSSSQEPNSASYDKLKQELIIEFRKELQTFKQDIINCNFFFKFNSSWFDLGDLIFLFFFFIKKKSYFKRATEIDGLESKSMIQVYINYK